MTQQKTPRLAAFQYRDFRLLWIGRLFSNIGSQMQLIAINWHIFALLRNQTYTIQLLGREFELGAEALGLGTVGLVRVIPIILFALLGGILADTRDRRRLLIGVQSAAALFSVTLAVLTLTERITVPLIYLLTVAGAAVSAFEEPARQSLTPNLVPRQHFANAVSLDTLLWYLSSVVGPALAGVLVGAFDVGIVYVIDALSFGTVIVSLLMMTYRGRRHRLHRHSRHAAPDVDARPFAWPDDQRQHGLFYGRSAARRIGSRVGGRGDQRPDCHRYRRHRYRPRYRLDCLALSRLAAV